MAIPWHETRVWGEGLSAIGSTVESKGRIPGMPTLNIKDPEVYRLAKQLAAQRHTSATGAVREALREALMRDAEMRDGVAERLLDIGARSAARPARFVTDADLYDEAGLPR